MYWDYETDDMIMTQFFYDDNDPESNKIPTNNIFYDIQTKNYYLCEPKELLDE